ncbi:MAG: AAA family ATPase [Treponema sp.]|nr:AAA family ATPase [Treponema sp.]
MLLKRLEIKNVRKIKQAIIDFHGPGLQVIQGVNKSGKTSLAQSISLTMNGTKAYTPGMISHGEKSAEIIGYTDDGLKIRTVLSDSVKQTVQRLDETTSRYVNVSGGVREFLNSISSGLEFPWAMRKMTDTKIIELLKQRCGISEKIKEIDDETKSKEQLRTEIGRDKKKMGEIKPVDEAQHPKPADELTARRDEAAGYVKWLRSTLDKAEEIIRAKCRFNSVDDIHALIPILEKTVESAEKSIAEQKQYTQGDVDAFNNELSEWLKLETAAKAYDDYLNKKAEHDKLTEQYDKLTEEIETLRTKRKTTLAEMNLGVKDLEIGEDNALYYKGALRGVTDTNDEGNWSTAESVQVFFMLGARFSGELKILVVDNGESLDANTTGAISKWAETSGFLVILLKVAELPEELEDQIIYIKEGEVVTK